MFYHHTPILARKKQITMKHKCATSVLKEVLISKKKAYSQIFSFLRMGPFRINFVNNHERIVQYEKDKSYSRLVPEITLEIDNKFVRYLIFCLNSAIL